MPKPSEAVKSRIINMTLVLLAILCFLAGWQAQHLEAARQDRIAHAPSENTIEQQKDEKNRDDILQYSTP